MQIFPMLSFVEPATLVFGFVAANGIDTFLQSDKSSMSLASLRPRALSFATATFLVLWSVYRLSIWPHPVAGWRSILETGVKLAIRSYQIHLLHAGVVRQAGEWIERSGLLEVHAADGPAPCHA